MNSRMLAAQAFGWKTYDKTQIGIFIAIFAGLALFLIVSAAVKALRSGGTASPSKPRVQSMSHGSFRRKAYEAGFSESETEFLETYARKLGVQSPQTIFASRTQIDSFMRNAYRYIERHADTDTAAQDQKRMLFSIREALALRMHAGSPVRSSRQLAAKTPLSLVNARGAHYSSILVESDQRHLYVDPPVDAFGQIIRFHRGAKLSVYFYTGNHAGYSFTTHCAGTSDTGSRSLLALSHSESIKPLPSRRNQRRDARLSCRFYLVHVLINKEKGKTTKTVRSEKTAVAGIITNLSAGGLSLQTISPVNAGDFIKLEFDLGSGTRQAFASVIRIGRLKNGSVMHCKFVKVNTATVNEIMAFVYGYD